MDCIPWSSKLISRKRQKWHIRMILLGNQTGFSPEQPYGFPTSRYQLTALKVQKFTQYYFFSFFSGFRDMRSRCRKLQSLSFFRCSVIRSLKLLFSFFWTKFWLITVINWKSIRFLTRVGKRIIRMWLNCNWHWFLWLSKSHSSQSTGIFVKTFRCAFDQPFRNGSWRKIAQHISTPWSIFHFSSVYSAQCSYIKVWYTLRIFLYSTAHLTFTPPSNSWVNKHYFLYQILLLPRQYCQRELENSW